MSKVYFSDRELAAMPALAAGVLSPVLYSLRGPVPQMLLVTLDRAMPHGGANVRTAIMTPLSWSPYTMAVTVPLADSVVVENLIHEGAQCVLAEPARAMLRQLTICGQHLPRGISEAAVARFKPAKSMFTEVPSLADCPVNMECYVEHRETYHQHLIAFVRVLGGSIDSALLFRTRPQIVDQFPTNDVDSIVDDAGNVIKRVAMMGDLFLCPTFPVSPKQGWYATFDRWMTDLYEESYLDRSEHQKILAWSRGWQELFTDLQSAERARLRTRLTELCRLLVNEQWASVHAFLARE